MLTPGYKTMPELVRLNKAKNECCVQTFERHAASSWSNN